MKAVKKMEDLKGYELRTSGSWVKAIDLLGGTPIAIPMSDVPEAIQKGVVKGLVSSVEVMKDMNFAAYCHYITLCYLPVAPWTVIMNKSKWDSLPPDIKKVMDDIRKEHSIWTAQYNDRHEKESIDWSIEKYKIEVIKLSSDELKRWENQLKPLSQQDVEVQEGKVNGKVFLEDVLRLKERYSKGSAK
jgi:TRAP-type C4-dicarboxylate transport system substrate-binding protein